MTHLATMRVVIKRDGDWWVAQGLEYSLATQTTIKSELSASINRILQGRIIAGKQLGVEPFANVPNAPLLYFQAWDDPSLGWERFGTVSITEGMDVEWVYAQQEEES